MAYTSDSKTVETSKTRQHSLSKTEIKSGPVAFKTEVRQDTKAYIKWKTNAGKYFDSGNYTNGVYVEPKDKPLIDFKIGTKAELKNIKSGKISMGQGITVTQEQSTSVNLRTDEITMTSKSKLGNENSINDAKIYFGVYNFYTNKMESTTITKTKTGSGVEASLTIPVRENVKMKFEVKMYNEENK